MARRLALFSTAFVFTLLIIVGCSGGGSTTAPDDPDGSTEPPETVVATYDGSTLTLSEYEQAYRNANNVPDPATDSLTAYQEFLQQYVNFRLKVRAAREAGLDTLTSVQKEVHTYRQKMARPKVMRAEVYEPLARDLYERRQQEVDVSHILKRVAPDAAPQDTLAAYQEMQAIADSVEQGVPFAALAYRNSDDPSAQKKGQRGFRGRIGFLRAGQIVKPFEDRMYSVPPDSVSEIFRTQFGYHIIKVHGRRPAQPPIRLSHIMVRPDGNSARPRQLLDSLRTEIVQNNADFATLAKQYSEDRRSAPKGGDLGEVESTQSLPPSFRPAVTELDSIGAVSDVVRSRYGFHLIKLTDRDEPPSFDEAYESLKEELSGRPRVDRQKNRFARQVRNEAGTTVDTSRILGAVAASTVDTLSRVLLPASQPNEAASPTVATLGDSTFALAQVARHVMQADGGAQMSIADVIDDFLNEKALQYATARLEERDSSFAATMKEYREGLLVFQFMQDSVWTAAARDTAGLRRLYRQQRDRYRFPERVRTIVLRASADSLLQPYQTTSTDTSLLAPIVEQAQTDSLVAIDTVMVTEDASDLYRPVLSIGDGESTGPLTQDSNALLLLRDRRLPPRRKTFAEARSSVIRDYQERYEETVLSRLRRRYGVNTYPERLRQAFDDTTTTASSTQ
jgi:peptidyl-prolyl cis-trans isomerase SurA